VGAQRERGQVVPREIVIAPDTVVRRSPRAAFHPLAEGQGGVLLHVDTGAYHGLNRVGALIWEMLEPPVSFSSLLEGLRARFNDPPPAIGDEIQVFLEDLNARDLIEFVPAGTQP
jgi:hypothetical protein